MKWLASIFGGLNSPEPQSKAIEYLGFTITPQPMKEGGQFRLSALIEKDGKSHKIIRADTLASVDAANEAAVSKAKQVIDEQGDRMFR